MHNKPIALVTISSENFLRGTQVLLHSFLKHNTWFNGKLVVIDAGLSDTTKATLSAVFPVVFHQPSHSINKQLDSLITKLPAYTKSRARFYSLEMFAMEDYQHVVFLDSDILCVGNVQHLFLEPRFAACADRHYYNNNFRVKKTYATILPDPIIDTFPEHFTQRMFNTGVMCAGPDGLNPDRYTQCLQLLNPSTFQHIETGHTDTVVLNNHFGEKIEWLTLSDNFYAEFDGLPAYHNTSVRLVHFLGKQKPWLDAAAVGRYQQLWKLEEEQLRTQ